MNKEERVTAAAIAMTILLCAAVQAAEVVPLSEGEIAPPDVNGPQKALILMPSGRNFTWGETIRFAGIVVGKDAEKEQYAFRWVSSLDGYLGAGLSLTLKNLSAGMHAIEFQAVKNDGTALTDKKTINIKKAPLSAYIMIEKEGIYTDEDEAALSAQASGGYPPYSYSWRIDGTPYGTDASISQTFPAGQHTVELAVRDSAGASASATGGFVVSKLSEGSFPPLTVRILSPRQGTVLKEAALIGFDCKVSGGRGPYAYLWLADDTQTLATSAKFTAENLVNGTKKFSRITLKVADADGRTSSDSVGVTSQESCKKDGVCYTGETYKNCPEDCEGSQEGNCDGLDDGKCDPDCARNQDRDCFCNLNGRCETEYENAETCSRDCPTGTADKTCDKAKDGRCDPDCAKGSDPDCGGDEWMNYLLLLALAGVLVFVYVKFLRKRG